MRDAALALAGLGLGRADLLLEPLQVVVRCSVRVLELLGLVASARNVDADLALLVCERGDLVEDDLALAVGAAFELRPLRGEVRLVLLDRAVKALLVGGEVALLVLSRQW